MKHPNHEIQKKQDEFLKQCPENQREFHAKLFRIGNATYKYYELASLPEEKILKSYYLEWLEGLPDDFSLYMKKQGFEKCKSVLSFRRYINEREDIGLDEYLKTHLSEEDYTTYKIIEERTKE